MTGLKPDASRHFATHYAIGKQSAIRAEFLLDEYTKGIQKTRLVQRAKVEELISARNWLFAGFFCAMLRAYLLFYIL